MKNLRIWGFGLLLLFVWLLFNYQPGRYAEYGAIMVIAAVLLLLMLGWRWWPLAIPVIAGGYYYPLLGKNVWWAVIAGALAAAVVWSTRGAITTGLLSLFKGKPQYGRRWDDNPHGPDFDSRQRNRNNQRRRH